MYSLEDTYAVAKLIQERYLNINLEDVSSDSIYRWTLQLPEFSDDPGHANKEILCAILHEWFEEVYPV
jgi:FeS assembly protein IscX